jgi:hypothetical protein
MKRQKESAPQFSGRVKFYKQPKSDRYVRKPPQKRNESVPADVGTKKGGNQ